MTFYNCDLFRYIGNQSSFELNYEKEFKNRLADFNWNDDGFFCKKSGSTNNKKS